jgi:hypothetical protein
VTESPREAQSTPRPGIERLLRLYPRAWRARYEDEFRALLGDQRLHPQQVIDVVSGAIDAWLSSDVRNVVLSERATDGGGTAMTKLAMCGERNLRFTTRDSLLGAGVLIASTAVLTALALAARGQGWPVLSYVLTIFAFPGSVMLSMPFTFLKGQPWRAQVVFIGGILVVLAVIAIVTGLLDG